MRETGSQRSHKGGTCGLMAPGRGEIFWSFEGPVRFTKAGVRTGLAGK
jgi:hypothetical protein